MGKTTAVKLVPAGINPEVAVITMVVNAAVDIFLCRPQMQRYGL
tara:strand:+ start:469 stop:600 length:132 start_codon:yes stop_codon:yes gene_type:complete